MRKSYFDVVDENDTPIGVKASYDEVYSKGLWCRGVHILVYTPQKQIVMQKRSPNLIYRPDEVEISVGGGVDAGETPEQAAVRELHEELGIKVSAKQMRFLGKMKFNHTTKTQIIRNFLYSYSVCLPKEKLIITTNPEETTMAFFITERKLRAALRRHRIAHVGKITSTYAYWKFLLDSLH